MKAAVITMASANQRRRSVGAVPVEAVPAEVLSVAASGTAAAGAAGIGDPAGVPDGGAEVMSKTLDLM
jgi:hypothetical protein